MKRTLFIALALLPLIVFATYTQKQVDDMMDKNLNPFQEDLLDSTHTVSSPQDLSGGTEYRFTIDGLAGYRQSGPEYFTNRWDTSNHKMIGTTEYDSPKYAADIRFSFDPDVASEGNFYVRLYIDDSTPKLLKTYTGIYKGTTAINESVTVVWSWADDPGYDAKNDGVYITIEFDAAGDLYDKGISVYSLQ